MESSRNDSDPAPAPNASLQGMHNALKADPSQKSGMSRWFSSEQKTSGGITFADNTYNELRALTKSLKPTAHQQILASAQESDLPNLLLETEDALTYFKRPDTKALVFEQGKPRWPGGSLIPPVTFSETPTELRVGIAPSSDNSTEKTKAEQLGQLATGLRKHAAQLAAEQKRAGSLENPTPSEQRLITYGETLLQAEVQQKEKQTRDKLQTREEATIQNIASSATALGKNLVSLHKTTENPKLASAIENLIEQLGQTTPALNEITNAAKIAPTQYFPTPPNKTDNEVIIPSSSQEKSKGPVR